MIRKISGKGKTGGVGHLNVNNNKITDLKEITYFRKIFIPKI